MTNIHLGTINGTGDGKELLLAAINRKTGRNYTLRDFEFGEPTAITDVPTPTHNTSIKFGPKLDSGYYGVRTIFYNRIHASDLGSIIVPYDGETRLHQLLDKINEKYPNTGEKYYLTNEQGERLGEGTYIYKELPVLNEQDEQLLAILDLLPTVTPPIYSAFCIIAAASLLQKERRASALLLSTFQEMDSIAVCGNLQTY
jgi:hypothetical protein